MPPTAPAVLTGPERDELLRAFQRRFARCGRFAASVWQFLGRGWHEVERGLESHDGPRTLRLELPAVAIFRHAHQPGAQRVQFG